MTSLTTKPSAASKPASSPHMGRMAAHTGQEITFDEILNSDHEFAPDVDKLTMDSPAPLPAGPDGKYPIPMPGISKKREYQVEKA